MPDALHIDLGALPAMGQMKPVTLEEMDSVKLLNRTDTKYLTDERTLTALLSDAAAAGYRILVTGGSGVAPYDSVYFDTPELRMFLDHHNRRLVRQKVRTRMYVSSGETYLEIKRKNNHGRTKKKRTQIPAELMKDFRGDDAACAYLSAKSGYAAGELSPSLETLFRRITLVNPAMTERLTIDTCVGFVNLRNGARADLRDAVVIELKQDSHAPSPAKAIFLRHRVMPVKVSKYCIGITLTDPEVKSNRFKAKVRRIEKQINDRLI